MGKMAMKSVIRQVYGTKLALANTIMAVIPKREKKMLNLKRFTTLGTSMKKLLNSASLDVAPQVMSISNMCASRACETWSERPPRKMESITIWE